VLKMPPVLAEVLVHLVLVFDPLVTNFLLA
jgi:hypothetical protein